LKHLKLSSVLPILLSLWPVISMDDDSLWLAMYFLKIEIDQLTCWKPGIYSGSSECRDTYPDSEAETHY
jgi:hypothetical protein